MTNPYFYLMNQFDFAFSKFGLSHLLFSTIGMIRLKVTWSKRPLGCNFLLNYLATETLELFSKRWWYWNKLFCINGKCGFIVMDVQIDSSWHNGDLCVKYVWTKSVALYSVHFVNWIKLWNMSERKEDTHSLKLCPVVYHQYSVTFFCHGRCLDLLYSIHYFQ